MKKYLTIFIIALAVFGLTARAFCYQAEVIDISGTKYFPAVKEALTKAEKSINVVMFTIESSLSKQDSRPNQLIDVLIEAKKKGVDVEVILDQNVDFVQRRHASDWETKIKSTRVVASEVSAKLGQAKILRILQKQKRGGRFYNSG